METKETPHIKVVRSGRLRDDDYVAFWIEEARGEIQDFGASNDIVIRQADGAQLQSNTLYVPYRSGESIPMLARSGKFAAIEEAVSEFNAHHAKLAEAAKEARAEAEKVPRRILGPLDLGPETTERFCIDCGMRRLDVCPFGILQESPVLPNGKLKTARHADCLAAEKRHAGMMAMLEAKQ